MSLAAVDMSLARVPSNFDEILDLVTQDSGNNIKVWRLERIAIQPGPRGLDAMALEDLFSSFGRLITIGDASNPPKLFALGMAAQGNDGAGHDVATRQKRAICEAVIEYLWRCTDHGGLRLAGDILVLPSDKAPSTPAPQPAPALQPQEASAERAADTPSVSDSESVTGRKRALDDLQATMDQMDGRGSIDADPTRDNSQRRPLTLISNKDKVSLVLYIMISARATHPRLAPFRRVLGQ